MCFAWCVRVGDGFGIGVASEGAAFDVAGALTRCVAVQDCIRQWRNNSGEFGTTVRHCPLCRVESYLVIPSAFTISDPAEKEEMLRIYKQKLASIPCKHFNYGEGECPFSSSCMYAHVDRNGNVMKSHKPRLCISGDGDVRSVDQVLNLWDAFNLVEPE
mmetsp:Transcript_9409/g.23605  ORF Transcript_9409/g.23605 Transcript_9409/m.23605 type:complete len:159 (+) Transcript_9409:295-771(+)